MPRTDAPTPADFETAYREALSLTDPLEVIRGVVTVYVPDQSCFLTDEEQSAGFAMYASRLSAFNRRGGYEVAIDRAATCRERWLAWLVADRLPGLVGLAIPRRDTLEETRKELEAAAAMHYITVRRAEAERVRSVGGDHREGAPQAVEGAKGLNRAELLTKYEHLTWAKLEERTGIPESTFRDRMRDGTYDTFEGLKIFEKDKNRCLFLKSWLNKNTRIFH